MTSQENDNESVLFQEAAKEKPPGLIAEFWEFLKENKKWWLLPIIVILLLLGMALFVAPASVPWIYALF